ncbi:MAG: hypothetical protein F4Z00_12445 [Acidimicrobiaceae bacterium]|nr:hypothetical protein [Acidimicrobiaceae bacterium]MXZ66336.1 hypothetical protein [Acidimicrobiaceae bacterium]MYF32306.1 hypothetical protein [Acidimicrobiaceae bacterium]MYG77533.1 hypothetical protein [Acidimicrobiaceae bacterium]
MTAALLAAACGGGDDAAEESENLPADTPAVSEVIAEDIDRPDTTESDPTGQPEQADPGADVEQAAEPEPEPEPAPVRIGNRFEWCVPTQATWDAFDDSLAAWSEAEARVRNATDAVAAATDELDRAEAQETLDAAQRTLFDVQDRFDSAYWQALHNDLALAYRLHTDGSDDSRSVAYGRAWVAFIANADAATVAAVAALASELARYEADKAAEADPQQAVSAARREFDRALEIADSQPHLGEAVGEAWAAAEAVVAATRSREDKDNETLFALLAYDTGYTGMLAAGTVWNTLYKADSSDHEALAEALSDYDAARDEAIAALAEVDAAASEAIMEALENYRSAGPTLREAYTAWRAWQARVGDSETATQVQADYAPVREAEEVMDVYLAEEMLGGAAYSAFRASLHESCRNP